MPELRDHVADARQIALNYIQELRDADPMSMYEMLDADLTDDDVEGIRENVRALADALTDLINGWGGGGRDA